MTYTQTVIDCFHESLSNPGKSAGYHGTSIQTVRYAILHGRIPSSSPLSVTDTPGRFYFFPNPLHFPNQSRSDTICSTENPIESAKSYAKTNAFIHAVMERLRFSLDDKAQYEACFEVDSRGYYDSTMELIGWIRENHAPVFGRFSDSALEDAINAATLQKGVILVLDLSVRDILQVCEGDVDTDLSLDAPSGISLDLIRGIKPLGDREFDFLNRL
jgi:hypothetical protein